MACLGVVLSGCPLQPFAEQAETTGTPGECQTDSACDDKNPCSIDRCEAGACVNQLAEAGIACGDADFCNGDETCDGAGVCVPGAPVLVDDGEICTTDVCDAATGAVTHSAILGCAPWVATPLDGAPEAREGHSAVWTDSKMIIWGGSIAGMPGKTATGGVYDPASKVWTPTSMTGAPSPRHLHSAAWTGSKMIVWGGYGTSDYVVDGGAYDPVSDTWEPIAAAGAPSKRTLQAHAWTGSELFVWGGANGATMLATGALYDPAADAWSATPPPGGIEPRFGHTAVWAGDRVIIWGGQNLSDWLSDGVMYKNGAWLGPTSGVGAPSPREKHSAIWTGTEMVVWGGFDGSLSINTGGMFDPSAPDADAWTATSTNGAPGPREEHTALWTGTSMMVWGGCGGDVCATTYGDGGFFTPDAGGGSWQAIAEHPALEGRRGHTAVWTGDTAIVWGGRIGSMRTNTGAQATF